jgi:hypothetical protein
MKYGEHAPDTHVPASQYCPLGQSPCTLAVEQTGAAQVPTVQPVDPASAGSQHVDGMVKLQPSVG